MTRVDGLSGGDVFNARDLATSDVVKRFIAPTAFTRLLSDAHCVLEGPRGSGKTTLLRMLTPEAFALWRHEEAGESLGFIGVFVPADVRWAKQLKLRLEKIPSELARDALQHAVFSVAVSLALINTIQRCGQLFSTYGVAHPSIFFSVSRETESDLVSSLSRLWAVDVAVPSFNGLRLELRKRQHELSSVSLSLTEGTSLLTLQGQFPYLSSTWLDNLVTGIETVNDVLGRPEQRWAVLLDELEIVPDELLRSILEALRSTSQVIRFKLALSPTGSDLLSRAHSGASTPNDDYRPIKLWYSSQKDARTFSEQLLSAALVRMEVVPIGTSLREALGGSTWEQSQDGEDEEDETTKHLIPSEDSTPQAQRERISAFVRLYNKDESFKKLLDDKTIDPTSPPISDSSPNGTLVRKITPLVLFRDREITGFKYSSGASRGRGGRRGLQPYCGYPNLVDLTEGNPRWALTLAEALAAQSQLSSLGVETQTVQSHAIAAYVQQFASKLTVYPTKAAAEGRRWTPRQFMEALGTAITSSLYDGPFITDPALSFKVDQRALSGFSEYVRTCIDLGALVLMRRGTSAPLQSGNQMQTLADSRVRITFRLAPHFRLPLRSTKEQSMSAAIRAGELLKGTEFLDMGGGGEEKDGTTVKPQDEAKTEAPIQQRLL